MVGNTWNANKKPCFSVSKNELNRKSAPALLKSNIYTNTLPSNSKPTLKYSRKEILNGLRIKNANKKSILSNPSPSINTTDDKKILVK